MKAGLIFTGTGPLVILTNCETLDDSRLVQILNQKGISKYIAYEIPIELVKQKYGQRYVVTLGDLRQTDILRVVDHDGQRALYNFPLDQLGEPIFHEETVVRRAA
jgi:hypothetical protein